MKNEDELVIHDRGFPPEQVTVNSALSLHQKRVININIMEDEILRCRSSRHSDIIPSQWYDTT